jgi:hypothetical protein
MQKLILLIIKVISHLNLNYYIIVFYLKNINYLNIKKIIYIKIDNNNKLTWIFTAKFFP